MWGVPEEVEPKGVPRRGGQRPEVSGYTLEKIPGKEKERKCGYICS